MLLLHPAVPPWCAESASGLDLVLLTDCASPDAVYLRSLADNEEQLMPMKADGRTGALHRWRAQLPWDGGNPATRYAFKLLAGGSQHWLAADGPHRHVPSQALHFQVHRSERPPTWVRDQVFYQIFPDRFAQDTPPADRSGEQLFGAEVRPVVQPAWGAPVDPAHAANAFYGGSLAGVVQRLPYLHDELGVTALYLNPVFTAGSNHRYDTADYFDVDPHLGGNAALVALREATAARGMRLVLDAVVNHTGANHPWFNRWGRHATLGAAQSPDSAWRSWYAFDTAGQPVGWKGHATLPVLDFAEPQVQQAIYAGPDAVLRHWLRAPYAIDGWRLDVIHMLGEGAGAQANARHVRAMRQAIRDENPQGYVLGEHFWEATSWLQGEQEDGAMNYHGFAHPVRAWLAGIDLSGHPTRLDTADFERWLLRTMAVMPYENQLAQMNLLGSHDTPRFLTLLGGDAQRMALAFTLLFAWPGVPSLYYGDEIGLEGGPDPDCRRCFDWDRSHWNQPLFTHVQSLLRWRRTRRELRHGALQTLAVGAHYLVFARVADGAASIVGVNRGASDVAVEIPLQHLPLHALDWRSLDGALRAPAGAALHLTVPACGAAVALGGA